MALQSNWGRKMMSFACPSACLSSFVKTNLRPASHSYKDIHTKMHVVITKCKYSTREANGTNFRIRISMQSRKLQKNKVRYTEGNIQSHRPVHIWTQHEGNYYRILDHFDAALPLIPVLVVAASFSYGILCRWAPTTSLLWRTVPICRAPNP